MSCDNQCDLRLTVVMPSAWPTGGAEEALLQLLRSKAASAVAWQVIFLEDGPLVSVVQQLACESIIVSSGRVRQLYRWWNAAGRIAAAAFRFRSNLIFGWMTKGQVYGGLAAWRGGLPAAWFQHGIPDHGLVDQMAARLPTIGIFTCSSFVAGEQQRQQPRARILSVRPGVDLKRFDPIKLPNREEARRELGLPEDVPIIGIVGRLQRWKGMHLLLEAIPRILEKYPSAHCLIVGGLYSAEPNYCDELHAQARRLQIDDRIVFAGTQPDVRMWLQSMDIFVHASHREPFGLVVIEAMALGKPTIASIPGGPEEIIDDGINGLVVKSGDLEMLTSAILRYLDGKELARNCGREGRERASMFTSERFGEQFCSCVREMLR